MNDLLNRHVLVLNKHWLAVHVCTARRAMSLLYQGIAHVVTENYETHDFGKWRELSDNGAGNSNGNGFTNGHENRLIHTPVFSLRIPVVIVLQRYHRNPPRTVRFNRRNLFLRDSHQCQYCGSRPDYAALTIDHVIPRSRGGQSEWRNVVVACIRCNTKKGNHLSSECGMAPRTKPRRPTWMMTLRVHPSSGDGRFWAHFLDSASRETIETK